MLAASLMAISICCSSCLLQTAYLIADSLADGIKYRVTHYENEPYYSVGYTVDGVKVYEEFGADLIQASLKKDGQVYVFNFDAGDPVFLNFSVRSSLEPFVQGMTYSPTSLVSAYTMNKYGHYCYDSEFVASFEKATADKSQSILVKFWGNFDDPDTGETIRIRDGCITIFRNADVGYHDRDTFISVKD